MVHNKECLKNISWPPKKNTRPKFKTIFLLHWLNWFPHLLDSVLGWRPNPVSHLPALTQYCTSVWSYWWTLGSLYCNETKAKKTLTQDEANGLSGPCQRCMHSLTLSLFFLLSQSSAVQWMFTLAESIGLPIIHFLIKHKKPLGEDKHFPQIEQEQIKKFCAEFWAVVHLHLLQHKLILPRVHSLWNAFSQETQNFYLTRFIFF